MILDSEYNLKIENYYKIAFTHIKMNQFDQLFLSIISN